MSVEGEIWRWLKICSLSLTVVVFCILCIRYLKTIFWLYSWFLCSDSSGVPRQAAVLNPAKVRVQWYFVECTLRINQNRGGELNEDHLRGCTCQPLQIIARCGVDLKGWVIISSTLSSVLEAISQHTQVMCNQLK